MLKSQPNIFRYPVNFPGKRNVDLNCVFHSFRVGGLNSMDSNVDFDRIKVIFRDEWFLAKMKIQFGRNWEREFNHRKCTLGLRCSTTIHIRIEAGNRGAIKQSVRVCICKLKNGLYWRGWRFPPTAQCWLRIQFVKICSLKCNSIWL